MERFYRYSTVPVKEGKDEREKASFKVGVVEVAVLIVAATFLVPNPEGLAFEGKMLIGLLAAAIVPTFCKNQSIKTHKKSHQFSSFLTKM